MPTTPTPASRRLASPFAPGGSTLGASSPPPHGMMRSSPPVASHRASAEASPRSSSPGTSQFTRLRRVVEEAAIDARVPSTFPSQPFSARSSRTAISAARPRPPTASSTAASRSAAASSTAASRPAQPFAAAFALNARTTRVSHNLILGAAAAPKGDHRSVFARDFGVAHSRQQYINQDTMGMRVECLPFDANGW